MTPSEALRGSLSRPISKRYFGSRSESKRNRGPFRKPERHSSLIHLVYSRVNLLASGIEVVVLGAALKRPTPPRVPFVGEQSTVVSDRGVFP